MHAPRADIRRRVQDGAEAAAVAPTTALSTAEGGDAAVAVETRIKVTSIARLSIHPRDQTTGMLAAVC